MNVGMQYHRYVLVLALLSTALIDAVAHQETPERTSPTRLKYAEVLRRESPPSRTASAPDSDAKSIETGQLTLDFEFPMAEQAWQSLSAGSQFSIDAGKFSFRSAGTKDLGRKSAKNGADLKLVSAPEAGKNRPGLATLLLHWAQGTVTGKLDGRVPGVRSAVAADYLEVAEGEFFTQVIVKIQLGPSLAVAELPIVGELTRKASGHGDSPGIVETVRVRGEPRKH